MVSLKQVSESNLIKLFEIQHKTYRNKNGKNEFEISLSQMPFEVFATLIIKGDFKCFSICSDNKIVGSILFKISKNSLNVISIVILKEYQNIGIGSNSLMELFEIYNDIDEFFVECSKLDKIACALFEKVGFKLTGQEKIDNKNKALICYKKILR